MRIQDLSKNVFAIILGVVSILTSVFLMIIAVPMLRAFSWLAPYMGYEAGGFIIPFLIIVFMVIIVFYRLRNLHRI